MTDGSLRARPPDLDDAAAVADLVIAHERSLYGTTGYSLGDLLAEWETLDLARDALVLVDGDRVVAFGCLFDRGELWRIDAYVDPQERGRGLGREIAASLEATAASRGARRIQNSIAELDEAGHRLLEELGYRPVRVFREMRIDLEAPPAPPVWPAGLVPGGFDADRDAVAFHAAQQEAFADHWEFRERGLAEWREFHIDNERFDPTLWRVVRQGDEIVAGVICEAERYGGGWVAVLFTRRPWRAQGVGRALLRESFATFWARGETSVGLGVDAASETGAFHLYESVGMQPVMGWVLHEKHVGA